MGSCLQAASGRASSLSSLHRPTTPRKADSKLFFINYESSSEADTKFFSPSSLEQFFFSSLLLARIINCRGERNPAKLSSNVKWLIAFGGWCWSSNYNLLFWLNQKFELSLVPWICVWFRHCLASQQRGMWFASRIDAQSFYRLKFMRDTAQHCVSDGWSSVVGSTASHDDRAARKNRTRARPT